MHLGQEFIYRGKHYKITEIDEMCDVVITLMSIFEHYGIDLEKAVKRKMRYNEVRDD